MTSTLCLLLLCSAMFLSSSTLAAAQNSGLDGTYILDETDSDNTNEVIEDAVGKLNTIPRGPFGETWPYLLAMIRVIRDYQRGDYRDMAASKLLIIIAAIIYFVSPFDVIPDWIPVLGHIDDAFVVALALKSVRTDLDTFMAWETARI